MIKEKQYLLTETKNFLHEKKYIFFADFNKTNVKNISNIRKILCLQNSEMKIIKNTIFYKAIEDLNIHKNMPIMKGQTAIIVSNEDPYNIIKAIHNNNKNFKLKMAILFNKIAQENDIKTIYKLPNLNILKNNLLNILIKQQNLFLLFCKNVMLKFIVTLINKKNLDNK